MIGVLFKLRSLSACALLAVAAASGFAAKSSRPEWLEQALKETAAYQRIGDKENALVLHESLHRSFTASGSTRSTVRYAVHLRTRDHRDMAMARIPLANRSQKVASFEAWMIYPSGRTETFGKKELKEVAEQIDVLFSEAYSMVLDLSYSARDDVVFAYAYELAEKSIFLQEDWSFDNAIPTARSSVEIEAPADWSVDGVVMSGEGIAYSKNGLTHRWEARDRRKVEDEVSRPPAQALYSRIGITVTPPEKDRKSGRLACFQTWNDVARYGADAQAGKFGWNSEIEAKAKELVRGLSTDWERIRAICEYAQTVNYASISIDLNSGGGYVPHAAAEVFRRHYGDCKDMTALTRAMLGSLGIGSHAVLASVGAEQFVHASWPSPQQFNHCIVGIEVDPSIQANAVVEQKGLGKLLIFDPTQRFVPLGELPFSLQGTKALVGQEEVSGLVELPMAAAGRDWIDRTIAAKLGMDGGISGEIVERTGGSIAESLRARHRSKSSDDFRKMLQGWIAAGAAGATIESLEIADDFHRNEFVFTARFSAPKYVRAVANGKAVFKPVFLGRHEWVPPTEKERVTDYLSSGWTLKERSVFELPEELRFEQSGAPARHESTFATYSLYSELKDGAVSVYRDLDSRREVVSPSAYAGVVEFYERTSRSDSAPVVLAVEAPADQASL